jgi:hypothetical protein
MLVFKFYSKTYGKERKTSFLQILKGEQMERQARNVKDSVVFELH